MVENIAIMGLDRKLAYDVAKLLSSELEMNFLDTVELFEFDNAPRTQSSMIAEFGLKLYRKKFRSTVKYASFFANTLINVDNAMAFSKDIFKIIKNNCLFIYLEESTRKVLEKLGKEDFKTKHLKRLYNLSEAQLERKVTRMKEAADIIVMVEDSSELKICADIIRQIKEFYHVA